MRAERATVDRRRRRPDFQGRRFSRHRLQPLPRVIVLSGADRHNLLRAELALRLSRLRHLTAMNENFKHVFGPVPSRRLGRSLGVDLVPFKTCSYDCIYCQLGRTTKKTVERKEWVPTNAVLDELKRKLSCRPDYITLSGSGEPTLHSGLGEIIDHIQAMTKTPVAVLTNGSLLWQPEVRAELALADVVMPSLDAGDELLFQAVNRPHPEITFEKLVSGLEQFRREFSGQYWLEVLLLAGHTALPAHVQKIAEWVRRIQPDRVQLNTAVRPPAEDFAVPVPQSRLAELARLFRPEAEVVAEYRRRRKSAGADASQQAVLELLRRRPCTEEDVAGGLVMRPIEAAKHLAQLAAAGRIVSQQHGDEVYYRLARRASSKKKIVAGPDVFPRRRGSIESDPVESQASLPETCKQRGKTPKPEKEEKL
jgi:wyosine [tRNA(Phe)-imidazoG37] synthetase (radical SAM superfamily)